MGEPRPIIFLDIDGVLNSDEWHKRHMGIVSPADFLDQMALHWLNVLVEKADAEIVISSTWRHHFPLDELKHTLFEHGLSVMARNRIVGATLKSDKAGLTRGEEIDLYWQAHGEGNQNFVILDDDYRLDPHMDHAILVNRRWGLQQYHIPMALPHLLGRYQCPEREPLPGETLGRQMIKQAESYR